MRGAGKHLGGLSARECLVELKYFYPPHCGQSGAANPSRSSMGMIDKLKSGVTNTLHKVENGASNLTHKVEGGATNLVQKAESAGAGVVNKVKQEAQVVGDKFEGAAKTAGKVVSALNPWNKNPDLKYDGMYVGKDGQTFPPNTPLSQIPAVEPKGGVKNNETIIYTNGIQTTKEGQSNSLQNIADTTGSRVIGVHNATQSVTADLAQCVEDKLDKGKNPAVDTLADTVYSELKAGHDVHLMGHSQGGLITARALFHVQQRLMVEGGMSQADAEKAMSHITVETFGAASTKYPDGPKYFHNLNTVDAVPVLTGLGEPGVHPFTHPGKDAKINWFTDSHGLNLGANHSFDDVYLKHRQPVN